MNQPRAYVINLARRPDRLARFLAGAVHLPFPVTRHEAIDGRTLAHEYDFISTPGARGCQLAHRQLLAGHTEPDRPIAVFEDDAAIGPEFSERYEHLLAHVPADWECLLLGAHLNPRCERLPGGVLRVGRFTGTHAYILRGSGLATALHVNRIARTHWDVPLGIALGVRGRTYALTPAAVGLSGASSDVAVPA